MKKLFICIMIMIMMVTLVSCGEDNTDLDEMKVGSVRVYVDKETGVNYLTFKSGYGGGITVRVDKSGKPIVSEVE